MRYILLIAVYTLRDEIRRKTLVLMLLVSFGCILLGRGCAHSSLMVNGENLGAGLVRQSLGLLFFNFLVITMFTLTGLLAMQTLSREIRRGSALIFLAHALSRRQYLLGKVAGLFLLCGGFLAALSFIFYFSTRAQLGFSLPAVLAGCATLLLGILFLVLLVFWLTLWLPPLLAAVTAGLVYAVSLFHDFAGAFAALSQGQPGLTATPSLWDWVWPQLGGLQVMVSSWILGQGGYQHPGPLPPPLNLGIYSVLLFAALQWQFGKKDL
jgi:ABC-type transport system involved in multi-copper enzyme maturation permease subunit